MNFTSFIGDAKAAIDAKGRASFPSKFRRRLTEDEGREFVLTRAPDHTLRLYVIPEYEKFMAELDRVPNRNKADEFRKWLSATVVELDGQDRILLPKHLMEYAGLKGEVQFAASRGKSLELWNTERFNAIVALDSEEAVAAFDDMFNSIGLTGGTSSGS
ncbi:MAG: MraZ family transcriptional regulator [Fibrobacter sp.]|nr:MraZ family transcriptional regulator [Fibrobacter sp.]